jgi:hypothetical protein
MEYDGLDKVKAALDGGADVNSSDKDGVTALEAAVRLVGGLGCVRLLIDRGADVNAKDEYGQTALEWAAIGGDTSCYRRRASVVGSGWPKALRNPKRDGGAMRMDCVQPMVARSVARAMVHALEHIGAACLPVSSASSSTPPSRMKYVRSRMSPRRPWAVSVPE